MPKRKTLEETRQDQSESSSGDEPVKSSKSKQTVKKPTEHAFTPTVKTVKKPKISAIEDNEESGAATSRMDAKVLTNAEGDKYVDLGKKKRATVRTFKGKVFLDIREYFGPDDDEKPGKKGISLQLEQWDMLKSNISAIDSFFTEKK